MFSGAAEGSDLQRDGGRGQEEASCRYRHSQVLGQSYLIVYQSQSMHHTRNQLTMISTNSDLHSRYIVYCTYC